jgi:hypothetical protein
MSEWLAPVIDRNLSDIKNAYKNLKRKKQNPDAPFEFTKAYLNYSDLNRIENNISFISGFLNVPIQAKTWSPYDIPFISDRTRILQNAESALAKIRQLYPVGFDDSVPIRLSNYNDFNSLENILLKMYELIKDVQYFPLDFIRTTNRQYFNTGYVPNDNTRIECEVMLLDNYDQYGQTLFGTNMLYLTYNNYGDHRIQFAWGGNRTTVSKSLPYYRKIKIILDKELLSWYDGETLIDSVSAPTGTTEYGGRPIWIGCYNNSGSVSNFGEFCLYSFKIYENNSLIMNFVPVKRSSDGVSGMLETLTNVFYPDVNGNGFLSSVFEDNFEPVNSVQTSGDLYVNTQIVHTVNTKIVIDSIPNTSSQYGSPLVLYGSRYNYGSGSDLWVLFVRNQQNWGGAHCMRGNGDTTYLDNIDFCSRCIISAEGLNMRFSYPDGTVIDKVLTNGALTDGINPMFLFDMNVSAGGASGSTGKSYTKFYSCQIYENNVLIRDFIPVKRLSDNALMLYDNVLKIPFLPKGGNFQS